MFHSTAYQRCWARWMRLMWPKAASHPSCPASLTPLAFPLPVPQDYQRYWARFMRLMAQNKAGGPAAQGEMQSFQSWRRSIGFE